jgi:peptidoglycan/xylan/chitin deacetylase (PgdA/CDA1 family)
VIVLTYHAVENGPAPLCVDPALFREHVRVIAEERVEVLTVSEMAAGLASGTLPARGVAITFDDAYESVAAGAAPVLAQHGLRATVFCVAGHVGGRSDWRSRASWAPTLALAPADDLRRLAAEGWEIGSHGVDHEPLASVDEVAAQREIVESRRLLGELTGIEPEVFAWPYGSHPSAVASALIAETYDAACAARPAVVRPGSEILALPRIDINYLRRPDRLRRALRREPRAYLAIRRAGSRIRRVVRPDHTA